VLFAGGTGPAVRCRTAHPSDGIDFADRCLNIGAMGVRTRGLDIKAGATRNSRDQEKGFFHRVRRKDRHLPRLLRCTVGVRQGSFSAYSVPVVMSGATRSLCGVRGRRARHQLVVARVELVDREPPDVILASGDEAAVPFEQATRTVPIVFANVGEPMSGALSQFTAQSYIL
jgi:hypothetical protein